MPTLKPIQSTCSISSSLYSSKSRMWVSATLLTTSFLSSWSLLLCFRSLHSTFWTTATFTKPSMHLLAKALDQIHAIYSAEFTPFILGSGSCLCLAFESFRSYSTSNDISWLWSSVIQFPLKTWDDLWLYWRALSEMVTSLDFPITFCVYLWIHIVSLPIFLLSLQCP